MKLERIIMHWTAGTNKANAEDVKHYHEIIEGDGNRVLGNHRPEANESTADGVYAAHVRAFNSGSIGLSVAGMAGAEPSPFNAGSYPITERQVEVFAEVVAEYAETYGIPIDREHVLTHAEVHVTYPSKPQPGKWDINWLPGMKKPGKPVEVGDRLREMIKAVRHRNFVNVMDDAGGSKTASAEDALAQILKILNKLNVNA